MNLFDVYPLFDINIVKGKGCHVWDENGTEYLDLYGGHAVISIGHAHPHYVEMVSNQVATLGFYSNSVINKLQQQVAERLGKVCGYDDYSFFLINSGAEANENALKLASFYNGRTRVISFSKAFHGSCRWMRVLISPSRSTTCPSTGRTEISGSRRPVGRMTCCATCVLF